jgi:hypothetical protein
MKLLVTSVSCVGLERRLKLIRLFSVMTVISRCINCVLGLISYPLAAGTVECAKRRERERQRENGDGGREGEGEGEGVRGVEWRKGGISVCRSLSVSCVGGRDWTTAFPSGGSKWVKVQGGEQLPLLLTSRRVTEQRPLSHLHPLSLSLPLPLPLPLPSPPGPIQPVSPTHPKQPTRSLLLPLSPLSSTITLRPSLVPLVSSLCLSLVSAFAALSVPLSAPVSSVRRKTVSLHFTQHVLMSWAVSW